MFAKVRILQPLHCFEREEKCYQALQHILFPVVVVAAVGGGAAAARAAAALELLFLEFLPFPFPLLELAIEAVSWPVFVLFITGGVEIASVI